MCMYDYVFIYAGREMRYMYIVSFFRAYLYAHVVRHRFGIDLRRRRGIHLHGHVLFVYPA